VRVTRWFGIWGVFSLTVAAVADAPDVGPHIPSQAAADVLRSFAGTDGAFLAGGLVKESFKADDLATLLQFGTDELVVVSLTGAQIRQAFEKSVSFYPQPNSSFLQISGFEVTFNRNAPPDRRVTSITAGGSRLEDGRTYTVAMPANLGRGGLGYFKIWDRSRITKTFTGTTLESILRGKRVTDSSPRWLPSGS